MIAFTLAEVLITLGIIGVVAAMTMPVLIQNHKKSVIETRLKKFYTSFNQAILMVNSQYGDYESWYSDFNYDDKNYYDDEGNGNAAEYTHTQFEKYLAPHLKIADTKKIGNNYFYYFSDGSVFAFAGATIRNIDFYPNAKYINNGQCDHTNSCVFSFIFQPLRKEKTFTYHYHKGLEPYKYDWDGNIESLYNGCKSRGYSCSAVIQLNGWKIPDNYPVKIR